MKKMMALMSIFISACAVQLQPYLITQESASLAANLTVDEAATILYSSMMPSKESSGFCSLRGTVAKDGKILKNNVINHEKMKLSGLKVSYAAMDWKETQTFFGYSVDTPIGDGRILKTTYPNKYEYTSFVDNYEIELDKVKRVIVFSTSEDQCPDPKNRDGWNALLDNGYTIEIETSQGRRSHIINVVAGDANRFFSAIIKLNPGAEFKQSATMGQHSK